MAAILGSAVATEAVNRLSSIISGDARGHEGDEERAERLEMAVLKIQSVVAVSEDWEIVHLPLRNWKAKLKRVGKEGDDTLHTFRSGATKSITACKGTIPSRITRAAKRFMPFSRCEKNLSDETLRRFERIAGGADEFLRYVQIGGRPKNLMFLKIPTESLLAGRTLQVSLRKGSLDALMLLQPGSQKDVVLFLSCDDAAVSWEKRNVKLVVMFHLSSDTEHIDIMGILTTSLELLPPQFEAARVTIKESVSEMLSQATGFSDPSAMSAWWCLTAWKCHRYSTDPSADKGCSSRRLQLPSPIIRVDLVCYTSPATAADAAAPANDLLPLKWRCHMAPRLVPNRYSDRYELIEPHELQDLLPRVTNEAGVFGCKGHWWCPRSCMYMAAEQLSVPPPTLEQLYAKEILRNWCSAR